MTDSHVMIRLLGLSFCGPTINRLFFLILFFGCNRQIQVFWTLSRIPKLGKTTSQLRENTFGKAGNLALSHVYIFVHYTASLWVHVALMHLRSTYATRPLKSQPPNPFVSGLNFPPSYDRTCFAASLAHHLNINKFGKHPAEARGNSRQ